MRFKEFITELAVDEMALSKYQTFGDFDKPGPFRGPDKKLVPHPVNQLKAQRFFERTPYDFRLFFTNRTGYRRYQEYGSMTPQEISDIFNKSEAQQIVTGHEDSITVIYVGNSGDQKVMMTPWIMAHRLGHAIQADNRKGVRDSRIWTEAESHFFTQVNGILEDYYSKKSVARNRRLERMDYTLSLEYSALFNAIGTQRSSRSKQIKRPYEFLYELFAQYLGTGKIVLNPLPASLGYGRLAWGRPTRTMSIKQEYNNEQDRTNVSEILARDMEMMFSDVLSSIVGNIYVI